MMSNERSAKIGFVFPEMERLREPVERLAAHFKQIVHEDNKIMVKYDSDADGVSGALILYRMFRYFNCNAVFSLGTNPVYSAEEARKDLLHHPSAHFIFIDFANNTESEEGLAVLRKGALSISIIDHHLSDRKPLNEIVVTPVWHGLDYNYTSGYLCYEVARRVCDVDYADIWKVSLYCDKSSLMFEMDADIPKLGLVFDYFASSMKKERYSIRMIDEIIGDKYLLYSIYLSAKDRIDAATEVACRQANVKTLKNSITLVLVNIDKVVVAGEFPPRGKVVGMVHDHFSKENNGMLVTLGYGSDFLSLRASASAREKGFNGNSIMQVIKKEYSDIIISGGGHPGAAALKFKKGFATVMVDAITKEIEKLS